MINEEIKTKEEETKEEVKLRIVEFFSEMFKEMVIIPDDLVKAGKIEFEEDGLRKISGSLEARKIVELKMEVRIE